MARVVFIEKRMHCEELGIMYLMAVLKKAGHEVRLVQAETEDADALVKSFGPDFVCYSICTGEHRYILELNKQLKARYSFQSVFGGPHPTFFPEIKDEPGVDIVVRGPGEMEIADIVEGKRGQGVWLASLPQDVDLIPFPDRDEIYRYPEFRDNPMKNVIIGRDCPYACAYCYNHSYRKLFCEQKHKFGLRRSVENVLEEIEEIRDKFPLDRVAFVDDHFIGDDEWLAQFIESYPKRIGLSFSISARVNGLKDRHLIELRNAGLETLSFALESASSAVRDHLLNKRGQTNERIREVAELCGKLGIRTRVYNMLGLPLEDPLGDALNTLKFNLELSITESWASIYQPYPRTRLAEYCLKNGFIQGDPMDSCSESFFDESRLKIPDRERINRLQKWWTFIVQYKLPMELVSILLDLPLTKQMSERLKELRFKQSRRLFFGLLKETSGSRQKSPA